MFSGVSRCSEPLTCSRLLQNLCIGQLTINPHRNRCVEGKRSSVRWCSKAACGFKCVSFFSVLHPLTPVRGGQAQLSSLVFQGGLQLQVRLVFQRPAPADGLHSIARS